MRQTCSGQASQAKPVKVLPLAFQIVEPVVETDAVCLQKTVQCCARSEVQQTAQFPGGEMAELLFIKGERFECAARQVTARRLDPLGELVGYVQRYVHEGILSIGAETRKSPFPHSLIAGATFPLR